MRRTLDQTLENELADVGLCGLFIEHVLPDPDQRKLLIVLRQDEGADASGSEAAIASLKAARGLLRSRVAAALQRKKTPQLAFAVLPARAWLAESETNPCGSETNP